MFRLRTFAAQVDDPLVLRAMRMLVLDGICSQILGVLTTGAFLIAFALKLGASNVAIGVVAAIPPLMQMMQIAAVYIVNRYPNRNRVVVISCFISRISWLMVAVIPFVLPPEWRIPALILAMISFFGFNAISACAWSSWVRDIIPDRVMGAFFARRMAIATGIGAAISLAAAIGIDRYEDAMPGDLTPYALLFVVGGIAGLLGIITLYLTPEPTLVPEPLAELRSILFEPLRHANYRNLLGFLGTWNFAVNFAAPFFTVYMFQRLGLPMAWVLGLSVISQIFNVVFYQIWGRLSDQFSNKSVLNVAGFLFILSFLIWPFTTLPERYFLSIPLVVVIHILAGISTAGVTLCTANIALKCAPLGRATSYLAVNAFISGITATIAPIIAGFLADFFATQEASIDLHWTSALGAGTHWEVSAFNLRGLDFIFLIAFVIGLYAMHRLLSVVEEGEVVERVVITELYAEVRKLARHASNVAGLRHLSYFPYALLRSRKPATGKPAIPRRIP